MASNWDSKKHKVLATSKPIKISDSSKILVEAYSYDGGEVKISIKTKITKKDGTSIIAPCKSFTLEQAAKVQKAIKKLVAELSEDEE
jgi:hypothetical protein